MGEKLLAQIAERLQAQGIKPGERSMVKATLIVAPSSTKNEKSFSNHCNNQSTPVLSRCGGLFSVSLTV